MTDAETAYREHATECRRLLAAIGKRLDAHAASAAARPHDWGFPGDLTAVQHDLNLIRLFLGGERAP